MGVKQSAAELGLNGTNLWVHPTPDHDANFARFVKDPSAPFPLLFISFPSAKDPEFERKYPAGPPSKLSPLPPMIGSRVGKAPTGSVALKITMRSRTNWRLV